MTLSDSASINQVVAITRPSPRVACVTINRPNARNAIDGLVTQALHNAVRMTELDPDIWVVVLTGSGDVAFSAGADLKEVSRGNRASLCTDAGFAGFVDADRRKPWIAAVEGLALAGGCEIALACDLIVASEGASFALPEVSRGLIAAAGGLYRLPRAIPRVIATELILTAGRLSATRAAALGMVNDIVPTGQALTRAVELAVVICAQAPLAVRESLAIVRRAADEDQKYLQTMSLEAQDRLSKTSDFAEGPRSFMEKRTARWTAT